MDKQPQDNDQVAENNAEQTQNNGQVMDVTAPAKSADTAFSSEQSPADSEVDVNDQPSTAPEVSNDASVAQDTSGTEPAMAEAPEPEPSSVNIDVNDASMSDSEPVTEDSSADVPPATPVPHHKGGMPVVAVIIAVVVAIGIAGLVIFAYTQSKDDGEIERTDTASNSQTVAEKPQASVTDVDATNSDVDTDLEKAIDETDFPSDELSDTALGL